MKDYEWDGLETECKANMSLGQSKEDYAYNQGIQKALAFIALYRKGEGLFQTILKENDSKSPAT